MPQWLLVVPLVVAGVVFSGCDHGEDIVGPGDGGGDGLLARIQTEIFDRSCVGCHRGGGSTLPSSLDLSSVEKSYQELVNVAADHPEATGRILVVPNDPDASFLLTKIAGGPDLVGARMPFAGSPLSAAEIQLVRDWIEQGAPRD